MKGKNRFVAVEEDGEVRIHIPGVVGYATLCGMDGDDPDNSVKQRTVELPAGARADCDTCRLICEAAWRYKPADFGGGDVNSFAR